MDPLSITTASLGLIGTIANAGSTITIFIKNCRDARNDLFAVHGELNELRLVLELLKDDASTATGIPQALQDQVINIIQKCGTVVSEIDQLLAKHSEKRLGAVRWVWDGKDAVAALQQSLATHRAALMLAVETIQLCLSKEIKADTTAILDESSQMKKNTDEILGEVARLRLLLSQRSNLGESSFMLDRYLDSLTTYAETVVSGDIERETVNFSDNESIAFSDDEKTLGMGAPRSQVQSPPSDGPPSKAEKPLDTIQLKILAARYEEVLVAGEKAAIQQNMPTCPPRNLNPITVTQTQPRTSSPTMVKRKVVPRSPNTPAPASEAGLVSQKNAANPKSNRVGNDQSQSQLGGSSKDGSRAEAETKPSRVSPTGHSAQSLTSGDVKIQTKEILAGSQSDSRLNQNTEKASPVSTPNLAPRTRPKPNQPGLLHHDSDHSGCHSCCAISSTSMVAAYLMNDQLTIKIRPLGYGIGSAKILTQGNHGKVNKVRFFPGIHHHLLAIEYLKPGGSTYNFFKDPWDYSAFEIWQVPEDLGEGAHLMYTSGEIRALCSWDVGILNGDPVVHSVKFATGLGRGLQYQYDTSDAVTGEKLESYVTSSNVGGRGVKASLSGKTIVQYDHKLHEIRVRTADAKAGEYKTLKLVYPKGAFTVGCNLAESERVWLDDERVTIAREFGVASFALKAGDGEVVEGQWLTDESVIKRAVPLQSYVRYRVAIKGYVSSARMWAKAAPGYRDWNWEKLEIYKLNWSISEDGKYLVGVKKARFTSHVVVVEASRRSVKEPVRGTN